MRVHWVIPILLALTAGSIYAVDPVGKWKLNEGRSKLPPGGLVPLGKAPFVSRTMTTERIGPDKYRTVYDDIDLTGQKRRTESVSSCDGQERPWVGRGAGYTELCQHIDSLTDRFVRAKDGKVVFEMTARISGDGKVMTLTEKGVRNGEPFDAILIFDKQ